MDENIEPDKRAQHDMVQSGPQLSPEACLLEAREVTKDYPAPDGRGTIQVLSPISFRVQEGEWVAIVGPSGGGKSTLLRLLLGLLPPSSGEVLVHGKPLRGVHPSASLVFQQFALLPWLTVLENVELGLQARGVPRIQRLKRALAAIDLVGLDGYESAYPRELSGGMKQRVGLARALVVDPELLCLDEAFSSLDVLTANHLRDEIELLWMERKLPIKAVLMVTHNLEEAVQLADRVLVLGGRPAHIRVEIPITLPRPRSPQDAQFQAVLHDLYLWMTDPSREKTPPLIPFPASPIQLLPHARVGGVAGLLAIVADMGGHADLHQLATTLRLEVSDLLPIVEMAQILGFAEVHQGDLRLLEEGTSWVQTDILKKKEVLRNRLQERIPLIGQIVAGLQAKHDHRLPLAFFLDLLDEHLGDQEAERQLQTAIDWGRYAELFAYDEMSHTLYLEEPQDVFPPA